ncbi:anoctamin-3-like isoform X1 [Lucilia sericata]|uniref:anoctamin-3-like isoform X1 n=1 Tax=Lucilia sericata TaxID=13632 RepID=UPI0018A81721|nr:anoctamin-3-like isoform X1 [Lucilia sericata]
MGNCCKSSVKPVVCRKTQRHFEDGIREVDFVIGFHHFDIQFDHVKKRHIFERNLAKEGLQVELDFTQCIHFIKIHAPLEVLYSYAEILKIKMPMKKLPGQEFLYDNPYETCISLEQIYEQKDDKVPTCSERMCKPLLRCLKLNPTKFPPKQKRIYSEFQINHKSLYDTQQSSFFDAGTRNSIVYFILERLHFSDDENTQDNVGIEKLLAEGAYICAYTLHDETDRYLLLNEWATVNRLLHNQPLDQIKEYFGAKIAIYFAWLGFYTNMLIPLSLIGLLYLFFGYLTRSWDIVSTEICDQTRTIIMCPSCDRLCDYWELKEICIAAKVNYLIDNYGTVGYAFITSIWAVLFLELWKRYVAKLVHKWGLTGYTQELEHARPQFLAKLKKNKKLASKMNHFFEPDIPFWFTKCLPSITNYSILLLFICISLMVTISMIVYRMAQRAAQNIVGTDTPVVYTVFYFPMASTVIELSMITALANIYNSLAVVLTNWEYCRTQKEYDESVTTKNFIFHFINYYSSLFYIAFIKGKLVGYPGKYNRFFGWRREECHHGGCLLELAIQLTIIMLGKQVFFGMLEMLMPPLKICLSLISSRRGESLQSNSQWCKDYYLLAWSNNMMYLEYLEMVIQYGFVTLFGLAFPLAPLLALINNLFETRLDAYKMLMYLRRPVAQRACDIGVWLGFLNMITKLAVASCAVLIAFSTNFITKLVYISIISKDGSLKGYTDFVLSHFNTKDFELQPLLTNSSEYLNVEVCRYWDFRNPPSSQRPFERPMIYWQILAAKLVFIVLYQNFIGLIQNIISWSIPDVSRDLQKRIDRENYLLREFIIEYEKLLALEQNYELE